MDPFGLCLSHLSADQRATYLATLAPGSNVDHRGTEFSAPLLLALLNSVRDPQTGNPRFDNTYFAWAYFPDLADFSSTVFEGEARFQNTTFEGDAFFTAASFLRDANFYGAEFHKECRFSASTVGGDARFTSVPFEGEADFSSAEFTGLTNFNMVRFHKVANFSASSFGRIANFSSSTFTESSVFTSAKFNDDVNFSSTEFDGTARFSDAAFAGSVQFRSATFSNNAVFSNAHFDGDTGFNSVHFRESSRFDSATFSSIARFESAKFDGREVRFNQAKFSDEARFALSKFSGRANFTQAIFEGNAHFGFSHFSRDALFLGAIFERAKRFGPITCAAQASFMGATFSGPVIIEISSKLLSFQRTHWESTAVIRVRNASVDLSNAVFEFPVSIAPVLRPFTFPNGRPFESDTGIASTVQILSLRGVDAAHLVLTNADLTRCQFAGTVHLDQLRLEGAYNFANVPTGIRRSGWRLIRWTPRWTLAEEHSWRSAQNHNSGGWVDAPEGEEVEEPATLTAIYRQLRKSFEDGKNEPDAADFYYGEMEMRRNDLRRPRTERGLITAYWALSGYGLRAARTLAWLLISMSATLLAMMFWGLPADDPTQISQGEIEGTSISLTTETKEPENPHTPLRERVSSERFEKGVRVVLNSVVFRSSGQSLTTFGTYAEMASRVTEPVLLGLAALAIRNRIKR
ncbi:pentapeptide repeat-containing protein [Streptomyces globisporus]|uniref:pentapeptide repeat-containing protein n=1 Tax=Streptomyces globisporus TaxID=1908 RepID=UPI00131AC1FD|nr:pentapeptide repeat-containing protein [Streptomyces globisporus]